MVGGVLYPYPPLTISTASKLPFLSTIGFAFAPTPPPPMKIIVGGPQGLGPVSQTGVLSKLAVVNCFTCSIVRYLIFASASTKIYVVPGYDFSCSSASAIVRPGVYPSVLLIYPTFTRSIDGGTIFLALRT